MNAEGMNVVGDVKIFGTATCAKCGYGNECELSGIKGIFGPDATVESVGCPRFEDQPETLKAAQELGERIAQELRKDSDE